MAGWQVGVDVGGTFTDVVVVDPERGQFRVAKVPSTPGDQSEGVMAGLREAGIALPEVAAFVHGTTVGTNAVLERKGVTCGLVTTMGFRDTLELGRRTRPNAYGMIGSFEPLIARQRRLEVPERMDAAGRVLVPLDEDALREAVATLLARGAEALVIHFLHSYANPAHERRAAEIARAMWPNPLRDRRPRDPERGARVRARLHRRGERLHPADHGPLPGPAAGEARRRRLRAASRWSCRAMPAP